MEMINSGYQEKSPTGPARPSGFLKSLPGKLKTCAVETVKKTKKIGEDDPRRIVHSMKVGLALTLVSLFYYFRPLYDGFGQAGMWAVLTVVVVFEFTVGGTLSKSINRGCATLLAGALGVGAEYLASLCGDKGEPVVLGLMVFFLAAASTFTRFFPHVKRKYDYGVLIFILTFSLVAVSGFRVTQILQLAHQRLSTILIGGATCMLISIFVCPVWAGQDLHNLVAANIEKLASFLEGFGGEFFSLSAGDENGAVSSKNECKPSFLEAYKSVLNSKATEESLANFAWWEPGHGRFRFHHPWKQYLKVGAMARECACLIETLNRYVNSKPQVASDFQIKIQEACIKISRESSKTLKEVASAIKSMTFPSSGVETHTQNYKAAADDLKRILETSSLPTEADLQEIMPALVVSSVLLDIIKCIDKISLSVHELSRMARFKKPKSTPTVLLPEKQQQSTLLHRGIVKPVDDIAYDDDHVVIEVHGTASQDSPEMKNVHPPDGAGEKK
ncbi:UNVERIFIED_CONTAM: Aluminum-activated malate transporter 8 [Sesamum calycinum]|uniref:Aluminum-activated malate transporter 8 n=1 Tax=Sesamum calycinum TaxID=2727403 RepID=A0AAW2N230_9LAMI